MSCLLGSVFASYFRDCKVITNSIMGGSCSHLHSIAVKLNNAHLPYHCQNVRSYYLAFSLWIGLIIFIDLIEILLFLRYVRNNFYIKEAEADLLIP